MRFQQLITLFIQSGNIIPVFRSMDDPHFAVWTIIAQMAGAIPQTPAIADG